MNPLSSLNSPSPPTLDKPKASAPVFEQSSIERQDSSIHSSALDKIAFAQMVQEQRTRYIELFIKTRGMTSDAAEALVDSFY